MGSFTRIIETNRIATTHDNEAVFTTSLESGIGRHMTAILASGLGSPKIAQGLATAELLEKDVCYDLAYITNGTYQFNSEDIYPSINSHLLQIVV